MALSVFHSIGRLEIASLCSEIVPIVVSSVAGVARNGDFVKSGGFIVSPMTQSIGELVVSMPKTGMFDCCLLEELALTFQLFVLEAYFSFSSRLFFCHFQPITEFAVSGQTVLKYPSHH